MTQRAELDDEELAVFADLNEVVRGIRAWGLVANDQELITAAHTIQGFVIQHFLQRVGVPGISSWYSEPAAPEPEGRSCDAEPGVDTCVICGSTDGPFEDGLVCVMCAEERDCVRNEEDHP